MSLSFRSRVSVFDANVGIGNRHDRRSPFDSPGQLLEEMSRHGVGRALVYPVQGEWISPMQGNDSLAALIDRNEALVPQFVAGCDSGSLRQLCDLHRDGLVSSVRLHNTAECRLPFVSWLYGDLLAWLSAEGIPLWVSLADTPPAEIVDTLGGYPDLAVVLVGAHYTHSMMIRPMMRVLPTAFLELSRYENICGIEKLVRKFGAERLLYGSFFPRYAMGPMLFALHHLEISEEDLTLICAANLDRVLYD